MYSSPQKDYLSAPQILNLIKRKPFTQIINGVQYTYSILSKIQKRFIMTNDRFLILKGIESIGYARSLPQKTKLPFRHQNDMPRTKLVYALSAIQSLTTQNQVLKIGFTFDEKLHWEFVCPSKACALQWRKTIQTAIDRMRDFNNRKYEKYEDYTKKSITKKLEIPQKIDNSPNKQQQKSPERQIKNQNLGKSTSELNRNESLDSLMLNNNNQQKSLTKSKSQLGVKANEVVLVKVPDNSQGQMIDSGARKVENGNFSKKNKQTLSQSPKNGNGDMRHYSFQPQKNKTQFPNQCSSPENREFYTSSKVSQYTPAPITHLFQQGYLNNKSHLQQQQIPEQLSKIQSFFLEKSIFESPSQTFLNKSFSTISMNGRQQVRSEIMSRRREWIDDLISRQQQGQLMIDFKRYSKKIVQVLVNQLHIPNQKRIFPHKQCYSDFASYIVDDVYVEIYFFSQQQIDEKHKRYQQAVKQFKNYDYFLEVTQNQQNIFVPLMTIFEFKGFVGMVKMIVCDEKEPYKNQLLFSELKPYDFEKQSRINAQVLLNQAKCKVVSYKKKNFLSKLLTDNENIYFIDRLDSFLPEQKGSELSKSNKLLRPEFVQDEMLESFIFGSKGKDMNGFQILSLIDQKIASFIKHIQSHQQYVTNSQELTELIHIFGLNVRHLGQIYKKINQKWLKMQFKAQLAARSLKTLFRFDLQNCILNQIQRMNTKEKQSQRQIRRVISFLNVVFGNSEATYRVWRGVNNYSSKHYGSSIWEDTYNDISIGYFLQALQHHFKIVLDQVIHDKVYFQSNKTFDQRDFVRFQPDISIYNLDFTENFEQINECLQQVNMENFHSLCQIMVKQTRSKKTYIQLLRGQPIYQKINQFLLNFISPEDNKEFYNKLESAHKPNRFIYESKLAQLRWHLKFNRLDGINKIIDFIQSNVKKWLGPIHPLFVQLNRILVQYYYQHKSFYMKAISLAANTLEMQSLLFGADSEPLWKDNFMLGKIYFCHNHHQNALPYLLKAKKLINIQNESSLEHFSQLLICLSKCYRQNRMNNEAYLNIRQLYNVLKQQGSQFLLEYLLESAYMIKDLLQKNQEYDAFYRFIQTDFSYTLTFFINDANLLKKVIQTIIFPYIKSLIFQKSKIKHKALSLMLEISRLTQSSFACVSYLQQKIKEKKFPFGFIQIVKDLDSVVHEIYENQLLSKWVSFHRMSNETLLQKIGSNQINRGYQFLADLSSIIGVLGNDSFGEISNMQR